MLQTTVLRPSELTTEQIEIWSQIQRAEPCLSAPFFRPEFTLAVANVRNDVEVAVLTRGDETVGFFPFQRGRFHLGKPVGGKLSDFQGLIVKRDVKWQPSQLMRDCRLTSWDFDHLVAEQTQWTPNCVSVEPSPYLDLSGGYDQYERERRQSGSSGFRQALRKSRKICRELGPLKLVEHTNETSVFETLQEWKSAQYRRSHFTDVYSHDWTIKLLKEVLNQRTESFAGMLSALYIGEQLAAIHLGIRSYDVLHCWFPAYNTSLAKYSAGLVMAVELARVAPSMGIRRIDLGKGPERYKRHLMSGSTMVGEGFVTAQPLTARLRRSWNRSREFIKSSSIAQPAQKVADWIRPAREWLAFH